MFVSPSLSLVSACLSVCLFLCRGACKCPTFPWAPPPISSCNFQVRSLCPGAEEGTFFFSGTPMPSRFGGSKKRYSFQSVSWLPVRVTTSPWLAWDFPNLQSTSLTSWEPSQSQKNRHSVTLFQFVLRGSSQSCNQCK